MSKRTSLLLVVIVLGLLVVGTSVASAQANCMNPDGCPLGQQNGPMGGGRFGGGPHHGMMGQGMMGGPQNGAQYGQQNGPMGRGQMGNGWGMMNGGQPNGCGQPGSYACLPPAVDAELTDEQVEAMTAGWQDEVNAQAIYGGIVEQFGTLRPFVNLQAAEGQHLEAWTFLFDRYGVELPAVSATVDVPEFATVTEACQFALDVETDNVGLYDDLLATFAGFPDITQVVTSLRDASEQHHSAALENCLAR